jgi:hypothetical protein
MGVVAVVPSLEKWAAAARASAWGDDQPCLRAATLSALRPGAQALDREVVTFTIIGLGGHHLTSQVSHLTRSRCHSPRFRSTRRASCDIANG